MFNVWCERAFPAQYQPHLEGKARVVGSASDRSDDPFANLGQAQAIIASTQYRYDGSVLDRAPNLCVISRTGIGYDLIAIPAATERGIVVCNAPDAPTQSTAELALALIFAVAKQLKSVERLFHSGEEREFFVHYSGMELADRQLGVVGLGRIGLKVARMADAVGMRVLGYDPFLTSPPAHITPQPDLERLLQTADIVSLHIPYSADTHHFMDASRFRQMKPGALFINTARGGLVDESALVEALDQGRLQGAGLDVLHEEPLHIDLSHPLLNRDNVIVTPHIASATEAGKDRLWTTAIRHALQTLEGVRPDSVVNAEVWEHRRKPSINKVNESFS